MSHPEPVSAEIAHLLGYSALCRGWAEQDEGPCHRDVEPVRRDIAEDRPGAPLLFGVRLASDDRRPLPSVAVDIWHCDALGRYSGFPPPDPAVVVTAAIAPKAEYLPGETFLRGRQITDAAGPVEFSTIYPDTIFATGGTPAVLDITRSPNGYRAVICLVLPSPAELR